MASLAALALTIQTVCCIPCEWAGAALEADVVSDALVLCPRCGVPVVRAESCLDELKRLRTLNAALADRVAAQAELLARMAER